MLDDVVTILHRRISAVDDQVSIEELTVTLPTDDGLVHVNPDLCRPNGSTIVNQPPTAAQFTLVEVATMASCTLCSDSTLIEDFLFDCLDDNELAEMVWVVERFSGLAAQEPAMYDCVHTADAATTVGDVINAHDQFAKLVVSTFQFVDDTEWSLSWEVDAIGKAVEDVVDRLDALYPRAVSAPNLLDILAGEARRVADVEQRPFDTTTCMVALSSLALRHYSAAGSEPRDNGAQSFAGYEFSMALRRAFTSRVSCDHDDVVSVPVWLVDHLRRYSPDAVLSRTYFNVDPFVIDTARRLWQPRTTEMYSEFDRCMEAARKLAN